jgi:hypothetical protein
MGKPIPPSADLARNYGVVHLEETARKFLYNISRAVLV